MKLFNRTKKGLRIIIDDGSEGGVILAGSEIDFGSLTRDSIWLKGVG